MIAPVRRLPILICLLLPAAPAAGQAQGVADYSTIVDRFAAGDADGAAAALSSWTHEQEEAAAAGLVRESPVRAETSQQEVEGACDLELEVALRDIRAGGPSAGEFRLALSRSLLRALEAWPSQTVEPFEHRWYRALVATFVSLGDLDAAWGELEAALGRFPADPHLHLLAGIVAETARAFGITAVVVQGRRPVARMLGGLNMDITERAPHRVALPDPAREYRAALDRDAALTKAAVRLGRVLALRGARADAEATLTRALAGSTDPALTYLAHLFLAQLRADAGDLAAAGREYQAARAVHPQWPTPYVALSELADRQGDRATARGYLEAAETLDHEIAIGAGGELDPWWTYRPGGRRELADAEQWLMREIRP